MADGDQQGNYGEGDFSADGQYGEYNDGQFTDGQYQQEGEANAQTNEAAQNGSDAKTMRTKGAQSNTTHCEGQANRPQACEGASRDQKDIFGGLESDMPEADIKAYFEKFGPVENVELPFDKAKNQRRQFAFVTFEREDSVELVCREPKQKIGNKECDIKKATPKPDARGQQQSNYNKTRRGGGGGAGGGGYHPYSR
ncbi:hypothetical protein HPB49_026544 [Dermacentor silvarum]|nr:hypothetical protein HPB49_026544 [Dermacentor silvarum]